MFKRSLQGEAKQTERPHVEAEKFIIKLCQFEYREKKITSKDRAKEDRQISDGGKWLIFRRNDLPIHHFVTNRHHGEVELGVLAGDLLQGGVEPSGEDLGRA